MQLLFHFYIIIDYYHYNLYILNNLFYLYYTTTRRSFLDLIGSIYLVKIQCHKKSTETTPFYPLTPKKYADQPTLARLLMKRLICRQICRWCTSPILQRIFQHAKTRLQRIFQDPRLQRIFQQSRSKKQAIFKKIYLHL